MPVSASATAGSGLDLGAVMRQVRHAFREHDGALEGGSDSYDVSVSGGHFTLKGYHVPGGVPVGTDAQPMAPAALASPALPPPAPPTVEEPARLEASPATFETRALGRDGAEALSRGSTDVAKDGSLRQKRGTVTELLANTPEGLSQSWEIPTLPAGRGDFVVRVAVSGQRYLGETAGGLHFIDDATGVGVRYGHATWVEANGHRTAVQARYIEGVIELRVPSTLVDTSVYPVVLDPVVGPEFGMDQPVATGGTTSRGNPAVASDGNGTSLVVFEAGGDIYGARVGVDGAVLDPAGIAISTAGNTQANPSVAWDGANYLVVWEDYRGGSSYDIYGTRVSAFPSRLQPITSFNPPRRPTELTISWCGMTIALGAPTACTKLR
jgi:hypothetical protein